MWLMSEDDLREPEASLHSQWEEPSPSKGQCSVTEENKGPQRVFHKCGLELDA